jgi:hypothetical protein
MPVSVFEAADRHNVDRVPEDFFEFTGHSHEVE